MLNKTTLFIGFLLTTILLIPTTGLCSSEMVLDLVSRIEIYAMETTHKFTLLLAVGMATLVSEDMASVAAGLLASKAIITPTGAVWAAALGIYFGDILLYLAGYLVGVSALHRAPLKWFLSERTVNQCKHLFERRGIALIISSRFIPGTRTATFFAAGMTKMNPITLLIVFALTVIIWTPILVLGAMVAGELITEYLDIYSRWAIWFFIAALLIIMVTVRFIVPLFTWRGRRLIVSWWRRLRHWEFWPSYVTNSVTFIYVLYMGFIKYRSPTLFTVTNPGIKPDSGFLWESKSGILAGLSSEYVGRWKLVSGKLSIKTKLHQLSDFMAQNELAYPIVLKPDRGQRGKGVSVCRTEKEAYSWLEENSENFIIMEYLPGEEFGVFYYRLPYEQQGKIFSITRKKLLHVVGDGKHTLEELILRHNRALCMAPFFFNQYEPDLLNIIPAGKEVTLAPIGTHSRGSLFLDGNSLATPELTRAVEQILRPSKGIYFGRFDLKAASEQDLQAGKNLKVIELNGLTSEATHIYDPRHSLLYGWKILVKQWKIAFHIADINYKKGNSPMPVKAFLLHLSRGGR